MARYAIECPEKSPVKDEPDSMLSRLAVRGLEHEDSLEREFMEQGLSVVNVDTKTKAFRKGGPKLTRTQSHQLGIKVTKELMIEGVDVIAQAVLEKDSFSGYADFLIKVPGPSELGDFHYEVWDTKLARRIKPGMVLQLCSYVDMLEVVQGCKARDIVVALGNGTRERVPLVHCFDYYLAVKNGFVNEQAAWSETEEPNPANYTSHGDWAGYAEAKLKEMDHLSQVARISRKQIEWLTTAGISTMAELSVTKKEVAVAGISATKMDWLVRQAKLQRDSADLETPLYEILANGLADTKGLDALPAASSLDVFFDIEGFPLVDDGLEYLWGCTYRDDNDKQSFIDWWGHDEQAELKAFEGFIDWVYARWRKDPSMHIYHYAPYETTACKRLSGKYGTREDVLDDLLRNEVFVDLYAVVTSGLQLGEPRYSIKNVERLYRGKRSTDVASGGDSVVVYDIWRDAWLSGHESSEWQQSEVLKGIRDYNIDDCDSTLELCEWLRQHQSKSVNPVSDIEPIQQETPDAIQERLELRDTLLSQASVSELAKSEQMLLRTMAGVLEFHRREDKNVYWRYFDRLDALDSDLLIDPDCIVNCRRTEKPPYKPTPRAKNLAYEYRFDISQEVRKFAKTYGLKDAEVDENGKVPTRSALINESDLEAGIVTITSKDEPPFEVTLVPFEIIGTVVISTAIEKVVRGFFNSGEKKSALKDFLRRLPPRMIEHSGGAIVRSAESALEDTIHAVKNLDDSALVIQGPPGTGKSYTGARIIANLLADGRRVGISSNSHAAIHNLLVSTARYCRDNNITADFFCTKELDESYEELGIQVIKNPKIIDNLSQACVVGTTAWGFCRDELAGEFDTLVIDEAGQVAIANLIGMSHSARNLVLMGDQRQLGQPTQGVHPAESGLSVLDYRLGDTAAVDVEHGVFLGTSFRMHPRVNALISKHVYDNRLVSHESTAQRVLIPSTSERVASVLASSTAGVVVLPVPHIGNTQSSQEEVQAIVEAVNQLTGTQLVRSDGSELAVTIDDMLFIAPYNAQVAKLKDALGPTARVGSVDKFQGQEAPVVFFSFCASDAADSPRGIGFLFNRNRLNVAVSRAETLCVLVGNPQLATTPVKTVNELKQVNFVSALFAQGL